MELDNEWVEIIHAKHGNLDKFFDYKKKSTHSWTWKSMLHNRNFLCTSLVWKIENGKKVPLWLDNWSTTESLCKMIGLNESAQAAELNVE